MVDSPKSHSPGSFDTSPLEENRPRSRRTGTYYQSTLTESLKDTGLSKSYRQSLGSMNDSMFDKGSPKSDRKEFQKRGLERVGTVTEGMLNRQSHSDSKKDGKTPMVSIKFVDKADWKDSPTCYVCSRAFDKMKGVFTHHCRTCGKAVCGECSNKKINDNRVCDVCHFRYTNPRAEERRKDMIKNKRATLEKYKVQLKQEKEDLSSIMQQKLEMENKMTTDRSEQERARNNLQREKDKAQDTLNKKMDTNKHLKESLEVDRCCLRDKEGEYEELKTKINALKLEISQKRTILTAKKEEFYRLEQQKLNYEASPSFVGIIDSNHHTNTDSVTSKNYSVMSSDLNGRVSLAKEPTRF